ncbi:MAG: adenylyltransferase/cytidyltransferase family protein [Chloroflexota bacterium]
MIDAGPPDAGRGGSPPRVVVAMSLDQLRSSHVRFLEEAARLGTVHVRLASDALVESGSGFPPSFPQAERLFLARSLRHVGSAAMVRLPLSLAVPRLATEFGALVVPADEDDPDIRARCGARGVDYRVIGPPDIAGFPEPGTNGPGGASGRRRVVVTGCFDWLHSGHVKFFRDAAALGDLYVIVGSDRNVGLLKGPGHPLQRQEERQYMVRAVRSVHRGLVSTGKGWMDAEPEIDAIAPHLYVVNEDGDQPEKRDFCRAHGLEYVVLERRPHGDLPRRTSTELRGY